MAKAKDLFARITDWSKAAKGATERLHVLALECMNHAQEHGDVEPMKALFLAIPESFDRSAFLTWIKAFSPIRYSSDFTVWKQIKPEAKGYAPYDLDKADSNPFWTFGEPPKAREIDWGKVKGRVASLDAFLKSIETQTIENATLKDDIDVAKVAAMRAALANVLAIQ